MAIEIRCNTLLRDPNLLIVLGQKHTSKPQTPNPQPELPTPIFNPRGTPVLNIPSHPPPFQRTQSSPPAQAATQSLLSNMDLPHPRLPCDSPPSQISATT